MWGSHEAAVGGGMGGVVDYAGKPSAAERTGADPYRGTGKAKYASELFK
jgi:hypothetical protein